MYTLSRLFLQPKASKTGLACFISQKPKHQINALGKLFGLIELTPPSSPRVSKNFCKKTVDLIAKTVEVEYYLFPKQSAAESKDYLESSFENALQKTNQKIQMELYHGLLSKGRAPKDWAKHLNLIIGTIKDNQIFFTQLGSCQVFLIHSPRLASRSSSAGKIINILDKSITNENQEKIYKEQSRTINPLKIFSHITSGQLENNDILLFSTENLLDYFSLEKLKKILLAYTPQKAVQHLEEKFKESSSLSQASLAAIILKVFLFKKRISANLQKNDSMEELVTREKKTTRLLHPILAINIFKKIFNKIQIFDSTLFLENFKNWVSNFQFLVSKPISIFQQLISRPKRIREDDTSNQEKIFKWDLKTLKSLPRSSKIILVSALILGFLFVQTIFFLAKQQEKNLAQKFYQKDVAQIESLWQAVETSLIYNHEEKAKNLLKKAAELINQLPQKTEAQKEKFIALEKENKTRLYKFWDFNIIEQPETIVDFNHLKNILDIEGMVYLGPELFAWGEKKSGISKSIKSDGILFVSSEIMPEAGPVKFLEILDENSLLLYHKKTTLQSHPETKIDPEQSGGESKAIGSRLILSEFDLPTKKAISLNFDYKNLTNPKDMALYSRWLYFLDPEKNQIFKYNKATTCKGIQASTCKTNFTNEQPWLKNPQVNLRDAVSMAIDGAIWILQKHKPNDSNYNANLTAVQNTSYAQNSWIIKLYTGYQQNFSLEQIEPKLEGPTKIYTHIDLDSLYILDPPSKRILIFDKNGKLQNQYFSEKFDDLRDFVIDKGSGKIYLLNGSVVYGI